MVQIGATVRTWVPPPAYLPVATCDAGSGAYSCSHVHNLAAECAGLSASGCLPERAGLTAVMHQLPPSVEQLVSELSNRGQKCIEFPALKHPADKGSAVPEIPQLVCARKYSSARHDDGLELVRISNEPDDGPLAANGCVVPLSAHRPPPYGERVSSSGTRCRSGARPSRTAEWNAPCVKRTGPMTRAACCWGENA